jgi:hypothetical protein
MAELERQNAAGRAAVESRAAASGGSARAPATDTLACDACGTPMKPMGHCKYWCLACGFLRTCNDVI